MASSNTVEDALLAREFLLTREVRRVYVVTSDFHLQRVRLVFKQLFSDWPTGFVEAATHVPADELRRLCAHERLALRRLKDHGIALPSRKA